MASKNADEERSPSGEGAPQKAHVFLFGCAFCCYLLQLAFGRSLTAVKVKKEPGERRTDWLSVGSA